MHLTIKAENNIFRSVPNNLLSQLVSPEVYRKMVQIWANAVQEFYNPHLNARGVHDPPPPLKKN